MSGNFVEKNTFLNKVIFYLSKFYKIWRLYSNSILYEYVLIMNEHDIKRL